MVFPAWWSTLAAPRRTPLKKLFLFSRMQRCARNGLLPDTLLGPSLRTAVLMEAGASRLERWAASKTQLAVALGM